MPVSVVWPRSSLPESHRPEIMTFRCLLEVLPETTQAGSIVSSKADQDRSLHGAVNRRAASCAKWWAREGSNLQPDGYEPPALTN